ncbi:MAG: lytic transglycosylase domain-containing protein [Chitinophagaceae bacterium]|nr:lytic transglycosylase domain-containing protein [Chitinophagaceae bacterium]
MRKLKQITVMSVAGFFLVQVARAAGIQPDMSSQAVLSDTTVNKDSLQQDGTSKNDPKKDFKNLFTTAVFGDGVTGAKLNPMAISFVQNYIKKNKTGFENMKGWAKPKLDMMDEILTQHGLPGELKYLAVIESGLKYNMISRSGAVGPWAFMPAAAQEYGLRINGGKDERLDYIKSTHAAARLLTDFYAQYGDWLLVIAAYNSGPGNVQKAIRKSGGSKDFWAIQNYLPNETMNHVKKFIGVHYIFEGEGGITTVTKSELKDLVLNSGPNLKEEELKTSTSYKVKGRFNSAIILKYIEMDMAAFSRYNPSFDNEIALNGKYDLRLPTQKMNIFVANRYQILDESITELLKSTNSKTR